MKLLSVLEFGTRAGGAVQAVDLLSLGRGLGEDRAIHEVNKCKLRTHGSWESPGAAARVVFERFCDIPI